jgi:transcriptional regulator with XRE-family HTH domain
MDVFEIIESLNRGGTSASPPEEDMSDLTEEEPPSPVADIPNGAPLGWRHRPPGTGVALAVPRPLPRTTELALLGQYVRRSRYYAEKSQAHLSGESGVTQSMLSRLERGMAPGMRVDKLLALASVLGRVFPLGYCPHNHQCAWDAIRRPGDPPPLSGEVAKIVIGSDLEVPSRSHFIKGDW